MLPIWLLLVTIVLLLLAGSAFYRLLARRSRIARDKALILKRVADLEEGRRAR